MGGAAGADIGEPRTANGPLELGGIPHWLPSLLPPPGGYGSFFFSCCADHRDLHSFPTRRSSDLSIPQPPSRPRKLPRQSLQWMTSTGKVSTNSTARSEEHTSELQSRRDLVCRLLLEKKKHHEHSHPFGNGRCSRG